MTDGRTDRQTDGRAIVYSALSIILCCRALKKVGLKIVIYAVANIKSTASIPSIVVLDNLLSRRGRAKADWVNDELSLGKNGLVY